ncbi:uncharacterized protein PAC_11710 [Phialocephala subalpina]|uniref:BTB domain-containing protein n=1 Tax=Phialocephala subalpina TaxID=576137 RepID=A0A1L7X9V5_9HELO|nr:uncharacterized protein PAC_11710 [Phialocephala subalpina]
MAAPQDTPPWASLLQSKESKTDRITFCGPQTFVNINVGSGQEKLTFMVQKSLICHYSAFFDAAFNGPFLEGKSQVINMEDVENKIMGLLVDWLYLQRIQSEHGTSTRVTMLDLAKLWVLADRCTIPALQAAAMKGMQTWDRYCEVLDPTLSNTEDLADFTTYVYSHDTQNGPLSKLYIDIILGVCAHLELSGREKWKDEFLGVLEVAMSPGAAFQLLNVMITGATGFGGLRTAHRLKQGLTGFPEPADKKSWREWERETVLVLKPT